MPEPNLNDTQPITSPVETQPLPPPQSAKGFSKWLVVLIVVAFIILGILGGYGSGINRRYAAEKTLVGGQLAELAQQYFEFIIRQNPNFPGIQEAYTDLLLKMQVSPTPVFSPTPAFSPTPDLRGVEEKFSTAQQLLNAGDWNGVIENLDSLRKSNPDYRTAEVDGMYYTVLRQRGQSKIMTSCRDTNLEGGIYDLTLAEHFIGDGNLDSVAESLRTYARLYIIGASFWDQDWYQAQYFFAQVMNAYPNMSDSSCMSATRRWIIATAKIGDLLNAGGDSCGAEAQYATAFVVGDAYLGTLYPTGTTISDNCNGAGGGGDNPEGTSEETPTACPTDFLGIPRCP
jgi:hypothetical protein